MRHLAFIAYLLLFSLAGCKGKKQRHSGSLSIDLYVYNDPSGNIYDSYRVPVSTLYFLRNGIIEALTVYSDTAFNRFPYLYISGGRFAYLSGLGDLANPGLPYHPLSQKTVGVRFHDRPLPRYAQRQDMPDTAFGGYRYRRTRIATDSSLTVFYVHQTDTLLPFSLAPDLERDYGGILNRIDTYEIQEDRFTSLRMTLRDTLPKSIFHVLSKKQDKWKVNQR